MKINEIFATIGSTSGNVEKSAIMAKNMNETIKQIYADTYDKQRNYGVKKFVVSSVGKKTLDKNYAEFHEMLEQLNARVVTGNAAIAMVENTIGQYTADDQTILKSILERKLTIGLSKASFDKLLGDEAEADFEVTLAYDMNKVKGVNVLDGTWWASRKCDGCVSADTLIEFENGVKLPIASVVDNRMNGKIKSYDETTGEIVYRDIEDWMHNVEDVNQSQKQWYQIELANGKILKITGNDSLYVNGKGWVKVEDLTADDEIVCDD